MEISKQHFVSVQLTHEETLAVLENYVKQKVFLEQRIALSSYKLEDYDPDCKGKGAFFMYLREEC
jgi:hypothetical protein